MLICRKFDEKCVEFFQMGKQVLPGFVHTAIGMEAIAAGACATLRKDDYVVVTHRGYNHLIARGASLNRLMAEICGRSTGICKGRAGWLVEAEG
jgi:pyruvate dehydrogenase E1 component alpha subunit